MNKTITFWNAGIRLTPLSPGQSEFPDCLKRPDRIDLRPLIPWVNRFPSAPRRTCARTLDTWFFSTCDYGSPAYFPWVDLFGFRRSGDGGSRKIDFLLAVILSIAFLCWYQEHIFGYKFPLLLLIRFIFFRYEFRQRIPKWMGLKNYYCSRIIDL